MIWIQEIHQNLYILNRIKIMEKKEIIFLLTIISMILLGSSNMQIACKIDFCSQLPFYRFGYIITSFALLIYPLLKTHNKYARSLLFLLILLGVVTMLAIFRGWNPHILIP
jgi:hypothetical protein